MHNLTNFRELHPLGVSKRTLEGWELGGRKPKGPARRLLQVAAGHPGAVLDAVHHS